MKTPIKNSYHKSSSRAISVIDIIELNEYILIKNFLMYKLIRNLASKKTGFF